MDFFIINEKYLDFLRKEETKIMNGSSNYSNNKFVVGVVLEINSIYYYAPISSIKENQLEDKSNLKKEYRKTCFPILGDRHGKNVVLSTIRLDYMFPVPKTEIKRLIINNIKDKDLKKLVKKEYDFIIKNENLIQEKAVEVYSRAIKPTHILYNRCCKFKNYCPISVGSIDVRYDNKNPAELYPNTTWELLSSDKYIKTGTIPLNTGGSNSISITKANLPNIKLKVDNFSLTTAKHTHSFQLPSTDKDGGYNAGANFSIYHERVRGKPTVTTSSAGGENTGTASPSTEVLGSGTALTIQPAYITLKFWKRLS